MIENRLNTKRKIKSPLNYIGGKAKILDQILPLFPKGINSFIDLFAGGFNVGINVEANKIYCNDNLIYLIEMFKEFKRHELDSTIFYIENKINEYKLSSTNEEAYKSLRNNYNEKKNPLDLFVLIAYSFNHQIRFNNNHKFNNPFGRERSSFNSSMKQNLERFIIRLKETEIQFSDLCFTDFDFSFLTENDFVYCDPPYLITNGTYNDGKRGFKGWSINEEMALLSLLDNLDKKNIRFALSNVLEHKGKSNEILKKWIADKPNYKINRIEFNYSNSNYHTIIRDKNASKEVLITNYQPNYSNKQLTLFN